MEDLGPLTTLLRSSEAVICRDETLISAKEITRRALALSEQLQRFCGGRVAVLSPHVDHIAIALAAAEAAKCSVVLYRGDELSDRLIGQWNISGVVDASLAVQTSGEASSADSMPYVCIPTSGTTGEPKLVRHTMPALLGRIRRQETFKERPGTEKPGKGRSDNEQSRNERSRWLFTYHAATFGGLQVLLTTLDNAADLICVSKPSISALRDAALARRVTHISGTPTFWRALLLALGDRTGELRLRQITLGGETADEAVLRMLRAKFPDAQIRHIYASTEAGALFSVRDGQAGFPAQWLTTGVDGVQLRIRDNILQVQSPRAMVGYAVSAASVMTDDGWLITGDQVEQVGDRVYFRGRQDSVLNVGGAKVKPEEIEEAILRLEEVADAHVYGVPNPVTGIVIGADVVARPGENIADLRQMITMRLRSVLEPYKIPRLIRFVESLTLTAAGKKQKTH